MFGKTGQCRLSTQEAHVLPPLFCTQADITNPSQHTPLGQTCLRFLFNQKSRQSLQIEQS